MPCTLPASLADAAVCRGSFHAVLGGEAGEAVFADFSAALQKAQAEGRILTASLFRYENHLFFYAEGLNRPFTPQGLCPALDAALLLIWLTCAIFRIGVLCTAVRMLGQEYAIQKRKEVRQ